MKTLTKAMLQSKLRVVDREAEASKNRARKAETKLADVEEQYRTTIDDLTTEVQEGKDTVASEVKKAASYQTQYRQVAQKLREAETKLTAMSTQENVLRSKLGTLKSALVEKRIEKETVFAILDQTITKLVKKETL